MFIASKRSKIKHKFHQFIIKNPQNCTNCKISTTQNSSSSRNAITFWRKYNDKIDDGWLGIESKGNELGLSGSSLRKYHLYGFEASSSSIQSLRQLYSP
jgi:hypothetical protein